MEEAKWMVWLGVQSGKKKCPKVFEEISSFVEEISSFVEEISSFLEEISLFVGRWWPRCFFCLARRELKKIVEEEKEKKCCWTNWFHQWKIRKTFGNLYIRYHAKESPSIIIFLWIVGSKHFRALLQKEVDFDFDDENAVQDNESSLNRPNFQGISLACI